MERSSVFISSVAADAGSTAAAYGLGMEIAHYCDSTALDDGRESLREQVQRDIAGISSLTLHAPFSELFPCAIDGQVRRVAESRYLQAIADAQGYGVRKVIVHAGYHPWIYYPVWFVEKSIVFWKSFVDKIPADMTVCLENVLEKEPGLITAIVKAVDNEKLRICLDIGHVNAYSEIPLSVWLEECAFGITHFHIHNNDGCSDAHGPLQSGSIPMKEFLKSAAICCPDAGYTLELQEAEPSVKWLLEEELL